MSDGLRNGLYQNDKLNKNLRIRKGEVYKETLKNYYLLKDLIFLEFEN